MRVELPTITAPDARDHRLAGHAHAARRRRGARRADPDVAPLRAARRRARPHGRGAERVQRRRAALPRRDRRRRRDRGAGRAESGQTRAPAARGDARATTRSGRRGARTPTSPRHSTIDVVVAAAGADRPVGEHDAVRRRPRGGARRTTPARPTRSSRRRACRYCVDAFDRRRDGSSMRMSSGQHVDVRVDDRPRATRRRGARTLRARRRRSSAHDERRMSPFDERAQAVAHVGVELGRAGQRLGRLRRVRARDGHRRVDDVGLGDERDDPLDLGPARACGRAASRSSAPTRSA